MAVEIKLPSLGDGVDSGDVLELLVAEGDVIEKDQGLVEMETDKATVIVPSDYAGKVVSIKVGEGDSVDVGQVILTLEASEAAESGGDSKPEPEKKAEPEKAPEPEAKSESEPEPEPAPKEKAAAPAKPAPVAVKAEASSPSKSAAASAPVADLSKVAAGPAIRRFAREVSVDLRSVTGTGENARITREDVLAVVRSGSGGSAGAAARCSWCRWRVRWFRSGPR